MPGSDFVVKRTVQNAGLFSQDKPLLSRLDIELTERCNNACMHCYINLPEKDKTAACRELDTEQWKNILKQASDLGALSVRLTGGEPLLREDFPEIYLYARRLGMKVNLFTNGRLLTAEMIDLLSTIPPMKPIEISVYGMSPGTYDQAVGVSGAYDEFRQGVERLITHKITFGLKFVVLPVNQGDIEAYEAWVRSLPGANAPSYIISLDLRTRRDLPGKNRRIREMRLSSQEVLRFHGRHADDYRLGMAQFAARFLYPQGDRLFDCGAGVSGCVDAYGKYQMCMLLRHPDTVYDLSSGTLREALIEFFPRIKEMRAENPEYLRRCARCFLKGLCEQCPAKSWSEHGTLDTPVEYYCQVAHAQARFLGLIEEGEKAWEVADWKARIEALTQRTASLKFENGAQIDRLDCRGSQ